MTQKTRDSIGGIWEWCKTLTIGQALIIIAIFSSGYNVSIMANKAITTTVESVGYIKETNENVKMLVDDRVQLRNDLHQVNDSLSSFRAERTFFYSSIYPRYAHKRLK